LERGASTPWAIAIVFTSAPAFLHADVHGFVRAVSVLHNVSQDLSDIDESYGQLELFGSGLRPNDPPGPGVPVSDAEGRDPRW
jgi:hypothetical protein